MTHVSKLETMAENVEAAILRAEPFGIEVKVKGTTVEITDTDDDDRRYTLTVTDTGRYEVAGFDPDSIEALIGKEAMIQVTEADLEAIADCMNDRYLSSDNFADDLRAATSEVLPWADHII